MDSIGARHLVARIRAGVSVGTRIELLGDPGGDSGLSPGDRGVVDGITESGLVAVMWDRGFRFEIDPEQTPLRSLAA